MDQPKTGCDQVGVTTRYRHSRASPWLSVGALVNRRDTGRIRSLVYTLTVAEFHSFSQPNTKVICMNLVMRSLEEILAVAQAEGANGGHHELSSLDREELRRVVGEQNLRILVALAGFEHNMDCAWQLDSVGKFADTMFSDELGPDAPYEIVAWSGSGDAWAVDRRDAKIVFLNHDGWESTGQYAMVVPLDVDLLTFIGIVEAWTATGVLIDHKEQVEEAATQLFLNYVCGISDVAAHNWPYC